MSKKYLLGVDGGTEGLRAGIFDISGTPLAYASTTYTTQFPAPSRDVLSLQQLEQDYTKTFLQELNKWYKLIE